jgi:hypothetical protein
MTEEARQARNAYARQWRAKNADRIRANQKKWRDANKEYTKQRQVEYWERKAKEMNSSC